MPNKKLYVEALKDNANMRKHSGVFRRKARALDETLGHLELRKTCSKREITEWDTQENQNEGGKENHCPNREAPVTGRNLRLRGT